MDFTKLFEKIKNEYPLSFETFKEFILDKKSSATYFKDYIPTDFAYLSPYDLFNFFSNYKIRAGVMPDINEWMCVVMKGNEVRYARTGFFIDKEGDIKARENAEIYSILKCFEISEEILQKK